MRIKGKTALITGSARRIGREMAFELARRGANVAVHYRSSEGEAREAVEGLQRLGIEAECFGADLTEAGAVEKLVQAVTRRFASIDILVNSASVFSPGDLDASTPELWDEHMDTNARAPFFLARAVSRGMRSRGEGKIVNIADPAGEVIWTAYFSYSVSKAALLAVTRGLARSLAPEIQINAVAPGPVHFPEGYTEDQKNLAIKRTLLKRAGSPDDVVRAVVFLVENDYVTGEVLHVDGGRHLL
jgi:pteridine reductase